ncbi:MAG TPA: metallophosphoesterase family protein [Bacteroidales bacterium]|nr:metallophosphoesterase family protein [Bacteroidales bacterium]
MKIILFTDTHYTNNNSEHNYKLKEFFKYMKDYAMNNNITKAIFCGDAYENKKMINIGSFDDCYSAFADLSTVVDIYAIGGNHDKIIINDNQYALKPFKMLMDVYLKPKSVLIDDKLFLFLPNGFNLDEYYDDQDYIICHTEILNAKYGSNRICETGINPKNYNTFFINGHLHQRQELKNCLIVGSPIYKQFGENIDIDKGFYILDTDTGKYEFKKYESPKYITLICNNDKEYLKAKHTIENDNYNHYRLELKFKKIVDINNDCDIKYDIKNEEQNFDLKLSTDFESVINNYIYKSETDLDKIKLSKMVKGYLKEV